MIKISILFAALCVAATAAPAGAAERPIVVELFTSEGCSSCPPADDLLAELATRPDVLALSFDVDYWDRLGWKDPFSSPQATERQQDYARLLGTGTVYTPQIVVDGRWEGVGSDRAAVAQMLDNARREHTKVPVTLALDHGRARIGLGGGTVPGSVWLIGFDRRRLDAVGSGENEGRTLIHVDVVRGFGMVGRFTGAAATIEAPLSWRSERVAAILQAGNGEILGAAVADASPR